MANFDGKLVALRSLPLLLQRNFRTLLSTLRFFVIYSTYHILDIKEDTGRTSQS